MQDNLDKLPTIENNVRIALANAGDWIGPADNGAIAALIRLSRLIDQLFDIGETKDLPPLLARMTTLMEQLQITPKSRADQDLTAKEDQKDGTDFATAYLRIVGAAGEDGTGQGKKPRTASGGTRGNNRKSSTTLAKDRPK
jgi:hypothetical protein